MHSLRDANGNNWPLDYLASIEILLTDLAEIWAESTHQVADILYKAPMLRFILTSTSDPLGMSVY